MDVREDRLRNPSDRLEPDGCAERQETNEAPDLSSTLDPGYIIHLIRQLLPGGISTNRESLTVEARNENTTPCVRSIGTNSSHEANGFEEDKLDVKDNWHKQVTLIEQGPYDSAKASTGISHGRDDNFVSLSEGCSVATEARVETKKTAEKVIELSEAEHQSTTDTNEEFTRAEDVVEEAGCVLWDLAASASHAEFLVKNHILDVLMMVLQSPCSDRRREVALGILGNLACHRSTQNSIVATHGLVEVIVRQLFVDDPPSLTETCRLLSAGLHSENVSSWEDSLNSEETLSRIMWMVANTMHEQLLEKSTELLLVMVDNERETSSPLLASLLRLELPELLTNLLASELDAVSEGKSFNGDTILDMALQIAEVLSLSDESAKQLAANQKLFSLACQVIRLAAEDEFGASGITAMVLMANLLAEDSALVIGLEHDVAMTQSLIDLLPHVGDDPGARNALWSILGRICCRLLSGKGSSHVEKEGKDEERDWGGGEGEDAMVLAGMVSALAKGCNKLVEDLMDHRRNDEEEDEDRASGGYGPLCAQVVSTSRGLQAKHNTAESMVLVMEKWTHAKELIGNGRNGQTQRHVKVACSKLRLYLESKQPKKFSSLAASQKLNGEFDESPTVGSTT